MAKQYQKMLDGAFGEYYERFRALNALSADTAVTRAELFPNGESLTDRDRMHKMLSMEIVKRAGAGCYWLDESRAANGNGVLKQRLIIIAIALVLGLALGILRRMGILNF